MNRTLIFAIVLLLNTVLPGGCSTQPVVFQFVQTHELLLEEIETITVNNCGNIPARPYRHSFAL